MTSTETQKVDREIYPMPMFATLAVSDLTEASALYSCAGVVELATVRGAAGDTRLVHLRRQRYQDLLLVRAETKAGSTVVSSAAGTAELGAIASALRDGGATVEGPEDTAWFTTDVRATDRDGNRVVLTAPQHRGQAEAKAWVEANVAGDFV